MATAEIAALQDAIRHLHGCDSAFVEAVPVREEYQGELVWEGSVSVFDLINHPTASRCYAWSHALDNTERRRYVAVLHLPPVDSPQKAVQVAIVAEQEQNDSEVSDG